MTSALLSLLLAASPLMYLPDGGTGPGIPACKPGEFLWADSIAYRCVTRGPGQLTFPCQSFPGVGAIRMTCANDTGATYVDSCGTTTQTYESTTRRNYSNCLTTAVNANVSKGWSAHYVLPGMEPSLYGRLRFPAASGIEHIRFWFGWTYSPTASPAFQAFDESSTNAYCGIRFSSFENPVDGGPNDQVFKLCSGDESASSCVAFPTKAPAADSFWTLRTSMTETSCTGSVSQDELYWETVSKTTNIPATVQGDVSLILGGWWVTENMDAGATVRTGVSYFATEHR